MMIFIMAFPLTARLASWPCRGTDRRTAAQQIMILNALNSSASIGAQPLARVWNAHHDNPS
jgi:hypothetical protein